MCCLHLPSTKLNCRLCYGAGPVFGAFVRRMHAVPWRIGAAQAGVSILDGFLSFGVGGRSGRRNFRWHHSATNFFRLLGISAGAACMLPSGDSGGSKGPEFMVALGAPLARVCCVDDSDSCPSRGAKNLRLEVVRLSGRQPVRGGWSVEYRDCLDFLFGSIQRGPTRRTNWGARGRVGFAGDGWFDLDGAHDPQQYERGAGQEFLRRPAGAKHSAQQSAETRARTSCPWLSISRP